MANQGIPPVDRMVAVHPKHVPGLVAWALKLRLALLEFLKGQHACGCTEWLGFLHFML